MPKTVRISDELHEMAAKEAALVHRSLAQQIEHWVKLGIGVERTAALDDVRAAALQYRHARDEADVRSGRRSAKSLHAIPDSLVKNAKMEFSPGAFSTKKKTW